ncbi:MAG: hypothetical protein LBU65_13885 [Planctomycetaceae bacterium]|nr:hypothetical protein [Planctomycetaceae bacterium]
MRKTRIYLDTSVVSMLDDSERGIITKKFFEKTTRESDNYEIILSSVLDDELTKADNEKKTEIYKRLELLKTTKIERNKEAENLAWIYVIEGVLTESHFQDLRHIAYAVVAHCDYVVSWNMRHLSNDKTITRVNMYNKVNNLSIIMITPPTLFVGEIK